MKYIPLNIELLKNPMNWVIILLMIAIAGFAFKLIIGKGKLSLGGASEEKE